MPLYPYRCKRCGAEIDIRHSIKEGARRYHEHKAPDGGTCAGPMRRLIAPGGSFVLKGGGWAKDGY